MNILIQYNCRPGTEMIIDFLSLDSESVINMVVASLGDINAELDAGGKTGVEPVLMITEVGYFNFITGIDSIQLYAADVDSSPGMTAIEALLSRNPHFQRVFLASQIPPSAPTDDQYRVGDDTDIDDTTWSVPFK